MADLERSIECVYDLAAARNAVVDCRKAVEHRAAFLHGFADAVLRLLVAVLTGIAVDGGRQQIRFALILQIGQKLNMLVDKSNACAGLNERCAAVFCVDELLGEYLVLRQALMKCHCLIKINILARGPLLQDFFLSLIKFIVADALILQSHC